MTLRAKLLLLLCLLTIMSPACAVTIREPVSSAVADAVVVAQKDVNPRPVLSDPTTAP